MWRRDKCPSDAELGRRFRRVARTGLADSDCLLREADVSLGVEERDSRNREGA